MNIENIFRPETEGESGGNLANNNAITSSDDAANSVIVKQAAPGDNANFYLNFAIYIYKTFISGFDSVCAVKTQITDVFKEFLSQLLPLIN